MAWVERVGERCWRVRAIGAGGQVESVSGFADEETARACAAVMALRRKTTTATSGGVQGDVTVREWAAKWIVTLDLDERTLNNYRDRLAGHVLPRWGDTSLVSLSTLDINVWVKEKYEAGYAPATVAGFVKVLSMLLDDAVDERLIPVNPVRRRGRRGRRSRRVPVEQVWATPEEVVRIAAQTTVLAGDTVGTLILTAAWTGCRWGELAGLHRDNLDLVVGQLVIDPRVGALHESPTSRWLGPPKTAASARIVTLPPFLVRLLTYHQRRHDDEFVFTNQPGSGCGTATRSAGVCVRPRTTTFGRRSPAVRVVPIRPGLTFHGLRHSHKTWLIAAGVPEIAQSRRLGHRLDRRVVEVYSHIAPEVEKRLIVELQRRWQAATTRVRTHPVATVR